MKKIKKNYFRNLKGTILPTAALMLAVIIPLLGIGVDISYGGIIRSSLESATEAASVAGAQEFFRSKADAGRAINETIRVFKMNVSSDTMVGNYHYDTGPGRISTLTFSKTFTEADSLNIIFRGSPITVTATTNLNRGKITVTSEITPKPFFAQLFSTPTPIKITKDAELPPYDLAFVFDLSGSMREATIMTYVGSAWRQPVGSMNPPVHLNDVVLYQTQLEYWALPGSGEMITANGYVTTVDRFSDIVINTPANDILTNATYDNGRVLYINYPKRGFITNTVNSTTLRRTALSGLTLTEVSMLGTNDSNLLQTVTDARSASQNQYGNYFNRAANYIEPHSSAVYGVKSFIDTVKVYGTAGLNLALVTFSSNSYTSDFIFNASAPELRSNSQNKTLRETFPYVPLVPPSQFNSIVDALTVMLGGISNNGNTINVNSYSNGGTNTDAGLRNALTTFQRSTRPGAQRVIILFTDGDPNSGTTFSSLGNTVRGFTDQGIIVYSVVLTLAVSQQVINNFRNAVENVGMAQPIVFISDPAQLDNAFMQIADDLGLKLVN